MEQRQPDYKKAEAMALDLLDKYDITEPPVAAVDIAKKEGLKVFGVDFSERFGNQYLAGFINSKEKTMYVNRNDSPRRQNFTIAHELGHWTLGHQPEDYDFMFRQTNEERRYNPIEREANCFAANLLMPVKFFVRMAAQYPDFSVTDMRKLFGVSEDAFKNRIQFLRL